MPIPTSPTIRGVHAGSTIPTEELANLSLTNPERGSPESGEESPTKLNRSGISITNDVERIEVIITALTEAFSKLLSDAKKGKPKYGDAQYAETLKSWLEGILETAYDTSERKISFDEEAVKILFDASGY